MNLCNFILDRDKLLLLIKAQSFIWLLRKKKKKRRINNPQKYDRLFEPNWDPEFVLVSYNE